jgi:hypothetical protein
MQWTISQNTTLKTVWSEKTAAIGGDLSKRAICGARTRQDTGCKGPAMKNGRCRLHGGASTGPRTVAGRQRIAVAQRQCQAQVLREFRATLAALRKSPNSF